MPFLLAAQSLAELLETFGDDPLEDRVVSSEVGARDRPVDHNLREAELLVAAGAGTRQAARSRSVLFRIEAAATAAAPVNWLFS